MPSTPRLEFLYPVLCCHRFPPWWHPPPPCRVLRLCTRLPHMWLLSLQTLTLPILPCVCLPILSHMALEQGKGGTDRKKREGEGEGQEDEKKNMIPFLKGRSGENEEHLKWWKSQHTGWWGVLSGGVLLMSPGWLPLPSRWAPCVSRKCLRLPYIGVIQCG